MDNVEENLATQCLAKMYNTLRERIVHNLIVYVSYIRTYFRRLNFRARTEHRAAYNIGQCYTAENCLRFVDKIKIFI